MHRAFISYHHDGDQFYKEQLVALAQRHGIFRDWSVDIGEISDTLSDQAIRAKIRDEYLCDCAVTIVLVGLETKKRKHVDWEIYSSMYNGPVNKQSGILVINLPTIRCPYYTAAHGETEKKFVYPDNTSWVSVDEASNYERYPFMPERIIDNLVAPNAKISVTDWDRVTKDPTKLMYLVEATYNDRRTCEYDLSRPMRRSNS